jgi:hypothetical protein
MFYTRPCCDVLVHTRLLVLLQYRIHVALVFGSRYTLVRCNRQKHRGQKPGGDTTQALTSIVYQHIELVKPLLELVSKLFDVPA